MSDCKHCTNGWLGPRFGDTECVNGVLIDIDVATEGWCRHTAYPPAPCQACAICGGRGHTDAGDCGTCRGTGWKSGDSEGQARLVSWAAQP